MLKFIFILFLVYSVLYAGHPSGATHFTTVTVDTGAETSTNYMHQVDIGNTLGISNVDDIINSVNNITVTSTDGATSFPKYVVYDSADYCLLYFDAPISATESKQYRVYFGTGLNVVNNTAVFTNNNINNYYGFDNFSGNIYYDYVGNNEGTGSNVDTVTSVFGVGSESSNTTDYISVSGSPTVTSNTANFTMSFGVNVTSFSSLQFIWHQYDGVDVVQIRINGSTIQIYISSGFIGSRNISSDISLSEDYLFTIVFDGGGATSADALKFYIDGTEKTLSYSGSNPGTSPDLTGSTTTLSNFSGYNLGLVGTLDEFTICTDSKNADWTTNRYKTLFDSTFYTLGEIKTAGSVDVERLFKSKPFRSNVFRDKAFKE